MNLPTYLGDGTDFYLAAPEVAKIVNLAMALGRPLLVEGEPGCGKTRLADSIAAELKLGEVVKIMVKSTSRAQDLLYRVNALRRLQDAQTPGNTDARFIHPYLALGPLGRVIQGGERKVVLLDEIDKADIDFPNDLLDVLDRFEFQIDDLPEDEDAACKEAKGFSRTVRGKPETAPIVVITSNREKRLPEPFLRRCLYVRVEFPKTPECLRAIVDKNTRLPLDEATGNLVNAAIVAFLRVRELAGQGNIRKLPSTSELIDWVRILHWEGKNPADLPDTALLPPHWNTLFKIAADLDDYRRLAESRPIPEQP